MKTIRVAMSLLVLASLAGARLAVATEEDDRTQAPATPEPLSASLEGWGNAPQGDANRFRELLGETEAAGWTWRLAQPFKSGELRAAFRSSQTGNILFKQVLAGKTLFILRARRDRALFAPRGRVEAPTFGSQDLPDLSRAHDRASAEVRQRFDSVVREGSLSAGWDADYGRRPDLSAGRDASSAYVTNALDTPSYASVDRRTFRADGMVRGEASGIRFRGDVAYRHELVTHDFSANDVVAGMPVGYLAMHVDDVRSTIAGTVSADAALAPGLVVGGLVGSGFSRGDPRTSRVIQEPFAPARVFRSENVDLLETRNHAVLGAAWLPFDGARLGARVQGETARLEGRAYEDRALAEAVVAQSHTVWRPWSASGQVDASISPARMVALDALALGRVSGGDDDVSRTLLSGATTVGNFTQDATRSREYAAGEVRATVRPIGSARVWVGEHLDRDQRTLDGVTAAPASMLVDRTSTRTTSFAGGRVRVSKHLSVEGKASIFQEDLRIDGARPRRNGLDTRVRVAGGYGPLWLWASGAWTDDRLDPREAVPDPAFAPIDFRSRMLVAGGGATLATKVAFLSISGSEAGASGDPKSRLRDVEGTLGVPFEKRYVVSAALRWLELHDDRAEWTDASGVAGMLRLGATF